MSEMGRRGFLGSLLGATAWALLPGGSFPAPFVERRMLVTPYWVTREIGEHFASSMPFVAHINRKFNAAGHVGDTVRVRLPL